MSGNRAAFNLIFRFVENYVSPIAGRISAQRHVMAIRDGFILSLIHISEPTRRLRGSRMPSSA